MTNMTDILLKVNYELSRAQSTYYWLLISILASIIWIVYLTYYNSRVFGLLLTLCLNKVQGYGHIRFGSFSLSVLSGKIMFRDVHWITEDYSVRIKYGYLIFRWWQPLTKKEYHEDLSHSYTRLTTYLEHLEYHIYNYSSNFSTLEKMFGLDEIIIPPSKTNSPSKLAQNVSKTDLNKAKWQWRDLIPVIKIEVNTSRIIIGNYLMPQSLLLTAREMHVVYTTKPASTPFDLFMHVVKCRTDNFKVMLVPSPKYAGKADEPPRCMGEGFAIMQSNDVEFYYYQDEPGLVPYEPESVYLANGDVVSIRTWPCWGMDVKCGKNTDFSYGPWCERQREHLWKFFFPVDYQPLKPNILPNPGQLRTVKNFDFKMSMQNDITIDLLFTKQKETQAIHMNCKQGSYLEFTIPMFLEEAGYTFTITGQLLHVDSSTSLKFRSFIECETLQFSMMAKYLPIWNDLQELTYDFTACKTSGYLIYNHITFFSELAEDWSSKLRPDIYSFVPYVMKVNVMFKEFELVTVTNQWNWVDCFGASNENSHISICGDTFDLSLTFPFTDFLPNTVDFKMFIRGESCEGLLYLPETNTNRHVLIGMAENLNVLSRDGETKDYERRKKGEKKWCRVCSKSSGWVKIATSPIVALSLDYKYHPISPVAKDSPFVTPEEMDAEEALLIPFKLIALRPLRSQSSQKKKSKGSPKYSTEDFNDVDVSDMEPDVMSIEIEIGPSVIYLYGSLVKTFLNLKENYFGEYQKFSDFEKNIETAQPTSVTEAPTPSPPVDPRMYRPFGVQFHLTLHEVQGHLVKNCSKDGEPCPSIHFERMVFELDKTFHETKLQVYFSPILLVCRDLVKRSADQKHLENGHMTLSALQIRGHALFSHQGLPIDSETLEYAWLLEFTVGDLVGRMTSVQLQSVVEFLQTFVCMIEDKENELICPNVYPMCQHMLPQNVCTRSGYLLQPCLTVADLKYEFFRFSIDCVDFYLVESGTALCLQVYPVRMSNCNLFNKKTMNGVTILLPTVNIKHYVKSSETYKSNDELSEKLWMESGGFNFGPLNIDLSKSLSSIHHLFAQQEFLRLHDQKFQKLNFLWNMEKCGCVGGCKFFGTNRNGPTFFHPSPDDFAKSLNVAVPHICSEDDSFGFGQSILRNHQLIFNQPVLAASKYFAEIFRGGSTPPTEESVVGPIILSPPDLEFVRRVGSTETIGKSTVMSLGSHDSDASLVPSIKIKASEKVEVVKEKVLSGFEISPSPGHRSFTQHGTVSDTSKMNLAVSRDLSSSQPTKIDFPISEKMRKFSRISIMERKSTRRLSLTGSPSVQKWQSEKELSQMKTNVSSTFEYGLLSKEGKLPSSKGSIYEIAPQSLEEKKQSEGSLETFLSATSLTPDHATSQNLALQKVKWEQAQTQPQERPAKDAPHDKVDSGQARKLPPTSLQIKSRRKKSLVNECYKCYLSQLQCLNWSVQAPVSSINRGLRYQGPSQMVDDETLENMVPHFVYYSKGFDSSTRLYKTQAAKADKTEEEIQNQYSHFLHGHFFNVGPSDSEKVFAEKSEFQVNDWIVVARIKESVNAMLSPLMLDSLYNYVEASTPILSQMHPSSIVDMLNIKCLNSVNEQEDKTTSPSCFSLWSDPSSTSTTIDKLELEKFHIVVELPQINICMLQACVNEDKPLSFNLDKIRDLTSVSLFVMSIDSLSLKMMSRAEIKSTSTLLMSNAPAPKNKKATPSDLQDMHSLLISNLGTKLGVGKKKNQDNVRLQKMLGQSNTSIIKCKSFSEVKKKSFVTKVDMSRIHFQLRRSRSLSNTPDPLSLTAIPASSSKVFFSFNDAKVADISLPDLNASPYSWEIFMKDKSFQHSVSHDGSPKGGQEPPDSSVDGVIGLLMFECGFENISFNAGGRFGYTQKETMPLKLILPNNPVDDFVPPNSPEILSSPEIHPDDLALHPGTSKNNASCFCTSRTFHKISKDRASEASSKPIKIPINVSMSNTNKSNASTTVAEDKTDSTVPDSTTKPVKPVKEAKLSPLIGDASSFGLEIKTLWFNFAAPPASSKEIKFLSNKRDWNLLSTATPSIKAWVNSCHKVITGTKNMYDKFNRRTCSVMACLMTDALEVQGIHLMAKSKYNKTTWESKFLQDDPSCQLLTVMRKYIHLVGADAVEASLAEDTMPQTLTIRNGLLVLTRQWKNVLYLPMFDENSFKAKKKVTVTFAVPVFPKDETNEDNKLNVGRHASQSAEEVELNLDNLDIIDESTSLLKAEGGSVQRMKSSDDSETKFQQQPQHHQQPQHQPQQQHQQHYEGDPDYLHMQKSMFLEPVSPIKKLVANNISNLTLNSGCSSDNIVPQLGNSADFEIPSGKYFLPTSSKSNIHQSEDLQKWMIKQQEYLLNFTMNAPLSRYSSSSDAPKKRDIPPITRENTAVSDTSKDGSVAMHKVLASPTFQLVDAQVLFKPLLKSLGLHLEAVRMSAIMKKFGGELSVLANLKEIKVEIVDSESTIKAKLKKRPIVKLSLRTRPAFLCKNFCVTLSMKDIMDPEIGAGKKEKFVNPADTSADHEPVYLKTVQLFKDTIEQIEAKPATTKILFNVTSQSVTQHVNMSLLRLVHQFVTMVEDVAKTKSDLDRTPTRSASLGSGSAQQFLHKQTKASTDKQPKRPDAINVPKPMTIEELDALERNMESQHIQTKSRIDDNAQSPFKLFKVNGEPVFIETIDSASPTEQQKTIVDEIKSTTPKCWKNLYHLLNLYNSMPDVMQSFSRSQLSVIEEDDKNMPVKAKKKRPNVRPKPMQSSFFTQNILVRERTPLIVFGTVHIKSINISAVLSGLKLHAELQSCQASFTHGEKIKGIAKKKSTESSAFVSVDLTTVTLLEGFQPSVQQTVVQVKISRSNGIFSTSLKKSSENSACLVAVGLITINIPQHPVALHTMVVHSSKRLSSTLQEFIKIPAKNKSIDTVDTPMSSLHHDSIFSGRSVDIQQSFSSTAMPGLFANVQQPGLFVEPPSIVNTPMEPSSLTRTMKKSKAKPIVIHFRARVKGLIVGASLLPSLKAQYQMGEIVGLGVAGTKSKFTIELLHHSLSFSSKVNVPSNVPTSASIALPPIHLQGEYLLQQQAVNEFNPIDGMVMREGNYLKATAEVGAFEHVLTTDLLNHLVFVQKVFMKEVNEVVQKVSGADQPVSLWSDTLLASERRAPLLYSFLFRLKCLQITATTPTNNAVRLETGKIDFQLSNRVRAIGNFCNSAVPDTTMFESRVPKVFFQVQVDLNLSLGTLIKNPMFEEAEAEFPHLASFATSITLRNALQDEIIAGASMDQEALLIALKRPIVFVLPSAFDKAILVWLNYRNAYEYWMEQRMALNKEIQMATQQVLTKIPPLNETSLGILFLQMTVDDLGICLPMNPLTQKGFAVNREDSGFCGALVLTLENARISACSYGSFVSKGKFTGFCLRFAEDFEVSWDDWKPEKSYEFVMNALVVPNGTFEMCSRTINLRPVMEERMKEKTKQSKPTSIQRETNNAKWILNILWQMKGIDIHLDTNIGKRLNTIWNTLTSLAGESGLDDANLAHVQDVPARVEQVTRKQSSILHEDLPEFVFDLTLDPKTRARLIENEMNEQAKVVQDLKMLRASRNTIEEEERKLQGLQAALFNDFRQDIIKRFKSHGSTKKMPDSKFSTQPLNDGANPRSVSMAGIKAPVTTTDDVKEVKNLDPHRVLDTQNLKVTPSHLRTHSFDVSQLPSKVKDDTLDGNKPSNMRSPIQEELPSVGLVPTLQASQPQLNAKTAPNEILLDESFKIMEFSDDDFEYDDVVDHHETKESDAPRNQKPPKTMTTKQIVEPAIDFELDVRAEVDSGKCVLHPKESKLEQTMDFDNLFFSKSQKLKATASSPKFQDRKRSAIKRPTDFFSTQATRVALVPNNNTVFFIPGVEVKVHYNSRTLSTPDDGNQPDKGRKVLGIKKANLYAWLSIQQLPEEMLISTSLLDFLEQAIEPIPIEPLKKASFKLNAVHSQMSQSLGSFGSNLAASNVQSPYTSFPVEVVVYIRVQPSMVRFTCLPVSRVECLLRVPSLDIVFSTKKVDSHLSETVKKKDKQSLHALDSAQSGGLSVSVCMSDFSLYVFHPYGGGQKRSGTHLDSLLKPTPSVPKMANMLETRKDSLSLNVEFLKINISRSRVGVITPSSKVEHAKHQQTPANVVQFSLVCDIGSASFKYDMRRLLEILALPKAWYRRTLARRLFLGEEMAVYDSESGSEDDDYMLYDMSRFSSEYSLNEELASKVLNKTTPKVSLDKLFSGLDFAHPTSPAEHSTTTTHIKASHGTKTARSSAMKAAPSGIRTSPSPGPKVALAPFTKAVSKWETLVLLTVNLPQLEVMVNMSNAMGNTVWNTKGLQCQGNLKIDSGGYKKVNLCAGLTSSKLEAKGGIIGGLIEVQNLHAQTFVIEIPNKEPEHKIQFNLHTLETRLDYMGSTILIGRVSDLLAQINDEWQLQSLHKDAHKHHSRSILVLVHGKLFWDKMHLMISRSTTPDLLKMVHKLEEFFSQQLMSGKRALLTFATGPTSTKSRTKTKEETSGHSWQAEVSFHRYWQAVLETLSLHKLSIFPSLLAEKGTLVGGSMNLIGKNITLACFHGMNFRSKFWALFTMEEPYIMFATEATDIEKEENKKMTQVIQNLTFQLRHNAMEMAGKRRMAVVYKLSRGHYMPPPFTSVQEWFHYAFANSDIKDLDKFPNVTTKPSEVVETTKKHATRRMAEYSHDTEIIFILPSFQMHLKTIQLQEEKPPVEEDKIAPVVECSFVTEFDDHIFVAMDAEAVLFIHDLITNYIKEKDKLDKMPKSPEMEKTKSTSEGLTLKRDIREYDCKTWHLEPTVRLLSWAGKEIDPVGVDYILQKLGFQHARLTIPKWMQRGFMDPLDKILSVLVLRLIKALQQTS